MYSCMIVIIVENLVNEPFKQTSMAVSQAGVATIHSNDVLVFIGT